MKIHGRLYDPASAEARAALLELQARGSAGGGVDRAAIEACPHRQALRRRCGVRHWCAREELIVSGGDCRACLKEKTS